MRNVRTYRMYLLGLVFGLCLASGLAVGAAEQVLTNYSFVPGEKFLINEDLSTTNLGEAPLSLQVNGEAEIVLIKEERWLKLGPIAELNLNIKQPVDDLTLEFNLRVSNGESGAHLDFTLLNEDKELWCWFNLGPEGAFWEGTYKGESLPSNRSDKHLYDANQLVTVAITLQKERVKLFVNKIMVMNVAGYTPVMPQKILVTASGREDEADLVAVKDVRLATVVPDIAGEILNKGKYTSHGVYFDSGKAIVKDESYGVLKQVAAVLTANPDLKLIIAGHTDNIGAKEANKKLSLDRAESVKKYLVDRFSVNASRLETSGKGDTEAIADNKTHQGRALNRRVEFIRVVK